MWNPAEPPAKVWVRHLRNENTKYGFHLTHYSRYSDVSPRTGGSSVEHRAVMREVVSSTSAGPTLRVLK